ncbi:MAG TPA: pilus assembly protein PilM [Candidatus Omnitrophota bacterium]|nr:pilus assembly protein PilM [Candidatus Omnitrophota bacterium]HQL41485.1 pilus assembly protein PilM [Candidatus Omnitrophota bacterium]
MKRQPLIVIEINERHCKILRAKPVAQDHQVTDLSITRIVDPSEEALAKLISSQISASDRKAYCAMILGRQQVILKNLSLPAGAKDELQKMISLQIATQVPYAREDIVFDYLVLGQDAAGYTKVLVAITHREAINVLLKVVKGAGLVPRQFILSSASIASWARQKLASELGRLSSAVGLLSLESEVSELCLLKNQQLVYARELKHGLRDIGGDFEDAFLKEVSLTFESFMREHPQEKIAKVFVLSAPLKGTLFERIQTQGQIEVAFVDPCAFLKNDVSISLPQNKEDDYASPVTCLGAIEEHQKLTFNLLPEKIRKDQQGKMQRRQAVWFIVLLIINLMLAGIIFGQRLYRQEAYLSTLKQQVVKMRSKAQEVQRYNEQVQQIEQNAITTASVVDIIDGFYAMTPKEASFQLLFLDRNDRLTIQGIAETRASVNDFQRNLISSPLFQDVNLEYAAQRRFFEGEITDFKITAVVKRGKEKL